VDADLMLISQDWSSADFLSGKKNPEQKVLGQVEQLETNKNLKVLLKKYMGLSFHETYATDAFVFIKQGPMNAPLPFRALVESTRRYALPQIAIVCPRMVICLGSAPFNAIRRTLNLERMNLSEAFQITSPLHTSYKGVPVFGVAHPGGTGSRAVGGKKVAFPRSEHLAQYFHTIRSH
jgi:uracil-DNA glycosylase